MTCTYANPLSKEEGEVYTLIQPRELPKVYGNNLGATTLEHKTQVKIDKMVPQIFKDFSFHHCRCRSGLKIWTHNCFCKDAMSSQPYPWSWVSITSCQTPMLYGLVFCWSRKRRVTTTANLLQQTKLACLWRLASVLLTNSILGMHSKIYAIQTNHGKFI